MNPTRDIAVQMVALAKSHPATAEIDPATSKPYVSPAIAFLRWSAENIPSAAPDEAEAFAQLILDALPPVVAEPEPAPPPTPTE